MRPPGDSRPPRRRLPRGFTLLEVMLAVAILVVISVTLYRFMEATMRAAQFSQKLGEEDASLNGLRRLVSAQLAALPANQDSTLVGMSVSRGGSGARRDALQMVCPAGNGVLSPDARGFYQVTLDLREQPRGSGRYVLGLSREPWSDDDQDEESDSDNATPAGANRPGGRDSAHPISDWVKLMDNVTGLEIAYFDARLNGWVDKWTDPRTLPNLVRLRLGMAGHADPYEIVERVPGGGTQRAQLNPITTLRGASSIAPNGGLTAGAVAPRPLGAPASPVGANGRQNSPFVPNGGQGAGPSFNPVGPLPVGLPPAPVMPPGVFRPVPIPGNTSPAFGNNTR